MFSVQSVLLIEKSNAKWNYFKNRRRNSSTLLHVLDKYMTTIVILLFLLWLLQGFVPFTVKYALISTTTRFIFMVSEFLCANKIVYAHKFIEINLQTDIHTESCFSMNNVSFFMNKILYWDDLRNIQTNQRNNNDVFYEKFLSAIDALRARALWATRWINSHSTNVTQSLIRAFRLSIFDLNAFFTGIHFFNAFTP